MKPAFVAPKWLKLLTFSFFSAGIVFAALLQTSIMDAGKQGKWEDADKMAALPQEWDSLGYMSMGWMMEDTVHYIQVVNDPQKDRSNRSQIRDHTWASSSKSSFEFDLLKHLTQSKAPKHHRRRTYTHAIRYRSMHPPLLLQDQPSLP